MMKPQQRRRLGVPKDVPAYCYPPRRTSRSLWLAILGVTAGWLWALTALDDRPDPTPERPQVTVIEIDLSAFGSGDLGEALGTALPARPEPVAAAPGSWSAGLSPQDGPATPRRSQPDSTPSSSTPAPTIELPGSRVDAQASGLTAGPAVALEDPAQTQWLRATPLHPSSHDCLRLCGRGPPHSRPLA